MDVSDVAAPVRACRSGTLPVEAAVRDARGKSVPMPNEALEGQLHLLKNALTQCVVDRGSLGEFAPEAVDATAIFIDQMVRVLKQIQSHDDPCRYATP